MHIRRPRAMRASVGRAGCALAAARARARASVWRWPRTGSWLLPHRCARERRSRWLRTGCCRAMRERRSRLLRTHACCAKSVGAPYERAQERALRREAAKESVRGAYTRARLARRMTATMMASGPASGERTIMTVLPTSAHESQKESVCGKLTPHASRTLTPHAQAARSGRTLRPHAQALRLRVSWRRHFGGQQGSSLQIDGCRRCGSDRSTE